MRWLALVALLLLLPPSGTASLTSPQPGDFNLTTGQAKTFMVQMYLRGETDMVLEVNNAAAAAGLHVFAPWGCPDPNLTFLGSMSTAKVTLYCGHLVPGTYNVTIRLDSGFATGHFAPMSGHFISG